MSSISDSAINISSHHSQVHSSLLSFLYSSRHNMPPFPLLWHPSSGSFSPSSSVRRRPFLFCPSNTLTVALTHLSVLWRNGLTQRIDWDDQIVLITGGVCLRPCTASLVFLISPGASGIGALLANTLALRSVQVVVLDIKQCQSDNGDYLPLRFSS